MTNFIAFSITGIVVGAVYAMIAGGLVVTSTTSGIFNFAHGAIGMFMAFTYWQLTERWNVPWPLAMLLVLLVLAPLLGAFVERAFVRPLYGASLSVTLVVTLGLLLLLLGVADALWPNTVTREMPNIFPGQVRIFGLAVTHYEIMVLIVSISVAGALLLGLVYNYSVGYLPNDVLSWWSPVIPMALLFVVVLALKPAQLQRARVAVRRQRRTMALVPSVLTGGLFVAASWVISG